MAYKKISPLDFYFAINGSYWSNEMVSSGFLPDNCLHISMDRKEKFFTIWNPELRADVMYQDIEYFNFPIPRLVFGIRMLDSGKVAECSMGVVADEKPTPTIWSALEIMCCPGTKNRRCFGTFPAFCWDCRIMMICMMSRKTSSVSPTQRFWST